MVGNVGVSIHTCVRIFFVCSASCCTVCDLQVCILWLLMHLCHLCCVEVFKSLQHLGWQSDSSWKLHQPWDNTKMINIIVLAWCETSGFLGNSLMLVQKVSAWLCRMPTDWMQWEQSALRGAWLLVCYRLHNSFHCLLVFALSRRAFLCVVMFTEQYSKHALRQRFVICNCWFL